MSGATDAMDLETLRAAFDRAFAEPPPDKPDLVELLAVGAGGLRLAILLGDAAGIHADKRVVPVPGLVPELLGVAAFRNVLAPIYDLSRLLGQPAPPAPRWILLVRGRRPLGLAFDVFEGQRRVARDALVVGGAAERYRKGVIRTPEGTRTIIDVPSLVEAIARRASGASKEA